MLALNLKFSRKTKTVTKRHSNENAIILVMPSCVNVVTARVWQIIARGKSMSLALLSGMSMLIPQAFEISHVMVIGATANSERPETMPLSTVRNVREENKGKRIEGTADDTGSERATDVNFAKVLALTFKNP